MTEVLRIILPFGQRWSRPWSVRIKKIRKSTRRDLDVDSDSHFALEVEDEVEI